MVRYFEWYHYVLLGRTSARARHPLITYHDTYLGKVTVLSLFAANRPRAPSVVVLHYSGYQMIDCHVFNSTVLLL